MNCRIQNIINGKGEGLHHYLKTNPPEEDVRFLLKYYEIINNVDGQGYDLWDQLWGWKCYNTLKFLYANYPFIKTLDTVKGFSRSLTTKIIIQRPEEFIKDPELFAYITKKSF